MSTPPASRGKRGGNDTVDDGGTDSFWRDFATRVAYRGEDRRGSGVRSGGGRGRRERIMNRLFISFSSVKLLRMAYPREPPIPFSPSCYVSHIVSGNTSCFVVIICVTRLQLSRSCTSYVTLKEKKRKREHQEHSLQYFFSISYIL